MDVLIILYPFFPLIGWGIIACITQGCMYIYYTRTIIRLSDRVSMLESTSPLLPPPPSILYPDVTYIPPAPSAPTAESYVLTIPSTPSSSFRFEM